MAYPYWFLPVPPVNIGAVKSYVDKIYKKASQTVSNNKERNVEAEAPNTGYSWIEPPVVISRKEINKITKGNEVDDETFASHFKTLYALLLRREWKMDMEANAVTCTTSPRDPSGNRVSVEIKKYRRHKWKDGYFENKMKNALFKIYVDGVVSKVTFHLEQVVMKEIYSIRKSRGPIRLKVGKSFVCAKGSETFDKNDVSTWNLNKGFGQRWKTYYHGHSGRLLGYQGMVVLVVITDKDLPDFVKGNSFLHSIFKGTQSQEVIDISSRESLALDIEDALGRPKDAEGNLLEGKLIGCPLDNDTIEHRGKPGKESDGSVVYLVYRPDLQQIIKALTEKIEELKEKNVELEEDVYWELEEKNRDLTQIRKLKLENEALTNKVYELVEENVELEEKVDWDLEEENRDLTEQIRKLKLENEALTNKVYELVEENVELEEKVDWDLEEEDRDLTEQIRKLKLENEALLQRK